uniref:Tubulin-specific chaperone A n=1 Tax=Angiostrongylus cantonensis TaxID=6313 RepID=A0A0K0DAX1_ANGCA
MSNTLPFRLGALTKAINRLKSSLNKHDQEVNIPVDIPSNEAQRTEYLAARKDAVKQATSAITKDRDSLETALDNYTKAANNFDLQTSIPDELKEGTQLNVNKTLEHIDKAEDYLSKLLEMRNELDSI